MTHEYINEWMVIHIRCKAAKNIRDIVNRDSAKVLKWKKLDVGEFKCNIDATMFRHQRMG